MALITCPECGGKVSDQASVCIHCGFPLQNQSIQKESQMKYCSFCGKENVVGSEFCGYCGKSFSNINPTEEINCSSVLLKKKPIVNLMDIKKEVDFYSELDDSEIDEFSEKQKEEIIRQQEIAMRNYNNQARCPKCGSTSLSVNKQGFGVGKAVAGAVLLGGIGLLAGGIGSNKPVVTCINCGHTFKL